MRRWIWVSVGMAALAVASACGDSSTTATASGGAGGDSGSSNGGMTSSSMSSGSGFGGSFGQGGAQTCDDYALRQLFGLNIDPANPGGNPEAQEMRDMGARWVRIEYKQSQGFDFYDAAVTKYHDNDVRVLLLVDYASVPGKPASNASDSEWQAYLTAFNMGVESIAAHYANKVDAYQVWNEPDLFDPGGPYDPGVPAQHYGVMLRDAVDTINFYSYSPVITAGMASGNPQYVTDALNAVNGELNADAVAVHPYGQRAPDDTPDPNWGFGNMSDLFDNYLAFGKPLWVTEIGTIDAPYLADYVDNVYTLAANDYRGQVETILWFCYSDAMVAPFGLKNANGTTKPAYSRYVSAAPEWDDQCDFIAEILDE